MDNLTHSLVGLFLARAGLKKATPGGTAILVLAANAPDIDAVSWLGGPAAYIQWHRNITHSLIGLPVMALLTVMAVRWLGRKEVRWVPATLVAAVAVASHLILDLTNVYGVRLLLPFSGRWFHWDITQVIDVAIWAILLLGVAAPGLGRLVGSEIGEQKKRGAGTGWAIFALLLLSGYDYGREILHGRAVALMDSRTYNGAATLRTGAFPEASPLRWTGIAETGPAYVEVPIDLLGRFRPEAGQTFYKAARSPAIETAMKTKPFQAFLQFVQYPIWIAEPAAEPENATRVNLIDLRFGTPVSPGFEAVATVTDRGRVADSMFTFGGLRPK